MYSRVTLLEIDTLRIDVDDVVTRFEEEILPRVRELPGFEGEPLPGVSGSPGYTGMSATEPRCTASSGRQAPFGYTSPWRKPSSAGSE